MEADEHGHEERRSGRGAARSSGPLGAELASLETRGGYDERTGRRKERIFARAEIDRTTYGILNWNLYSS